jgi:nitrate reductase gamma subunit
MKETTAMDFYSFVEGPLLWIACLTFIIGTIIRIVLFFSISSKKDKPFYQYFSWKYVFTTWLLWLLPFNKDVAKNPVFAVSVYIFHACLIVVPIWLSGHISLWEMSRFEWSWKALPSAWADWMTLVLLAISIYFILRRLISPDLRLISTISDYLLIIVTALPFLTGYFLAHSTLEGIPFFGENISLLHMLSGELMLILVPLTRLSHSILFFFSRAATGVEFGRRGYSM